MGRAGAPAAHEGQDWGRTQARRRRHERLQMGKSKAVGRRGSAPDGTKSSGTRRTGAALGGQRGQLREALSENRVCTLPAAALLCAPQPHPVLQPAALTRCQKWSCPAHSPSAGSGAAAAPGARRAAAAPAHTASAQPVRRPSGAPRPCGMGGSGGGRGLFQGHGLSGNRCQMQQQPTG